MQVPFTTLSLTPVATAILPTTATPATPPVRTTTPPTKPTTHQFILMFSILKMRTRERLIVGISLLDLTEAFLLAFRAINSILFRQCLKLLHDALRSEERRV